jgi:hypothetical protein
MKYGKTILFLFLLFSTAHSSPLELLDTGLLQLALEQEQLPPETMLNIITETSNRCVAVLRDSAHAQQILAHLAQSLKIDSTSSPVTIAQGLCKLILDSPSTLHVLYTLTQLTLGSMHAEPANGLASNADLVTYAVNDALQPFVKKERTKKIIAWLWISGSIALGITLAVKTYQYLEHIKQEKQESATKQKQTASALRNLEQNCLADIQELTSQTNELQAQIKAVDRNARRAAAHVQQNNIDGMKILQQKIAVQQKTLGRCINTMITQLNDALGEEEIAAPAAAQKLSFHEFTEWLGSASNLVRTLNAASQLVGPAKVAVAALG